MISDASSLRTRIVGPLLAMSLLTSAASRSDDGGNRFVDSAGGAAIPIPMDWAQLPSIPDPEGFAGAFAGVSGGALIVAGGANVPGEKWKEPFVKKWYASAFVLEHPDGAWKSGFTLPHPRGYGVSVTVDDSVICIGGSDETRHFADVFRLRWADGALRFEDLPRLPKPCANTCGALVGRTIYVAGGIETPTATTALRAFWALDLDALDAGWKELEPCPGPARMLAVAGALDGAFYLFSGASLSPDSEGKPLREFLRDAWRFSPGQGWTRLADLPRAAVAAPTPAPTSGSRLLVVTGDDGKDVFFQPVEKHPGFPRDTLIYDASTNAWTVLDNAPFSRATVPTARWLDRFVIPNGEARPRVRTPEVWSLRVP
jgi:N-acetylneuraminic acid mutarotase